MRLGAPPHDALVSCLSRRVFLLLVGSWGGAPHLMLVLPRAPGDLNPQLIMYILHVQLF